MHDFKTISFILILNCSILAAFAQKKPAELPSIPWLPDPMMLKNETHIETREQWQEQKEWIRDQLQQYYLGTMPPIPEEVKSEVLEIRYDGDVKIEVVELRFGKDFKAKMTIELYFPADSEGKLPVLMTQWNHLGWIGIGLRRGYMGCLYAGADAKDDTQNYGELYTDYNFARLMQRAWGATAVVTYLYSRKEVDIDKIAITGHSRNGKQSLYAAAFDERIDAVIPSSSGFGGVRAARHSDRRYAPHTMQRTMIDFPDWWIPELQEFYGHEDRLPVDMNSLLAIVAPRPCLLTAGFFDLYGDAWGLEKSYHSAKKAYDFLGKPESIQIRQQPVRHNTHARDIEDFLDFLDAQFNRNQYPPFEDMLHQYSFEEWKKNNQQLQTSSVEKTDISKAEKLEDEDISRIRQNISWLLGEVRPGISYHLERKLSPGTKEDNLAAIFRTRETIGNANRVRISPYASMGDQLYADFYYPDTGKEKYPVVIFLHEYTYAEGYGKTSWSFAEMNDYIHDLTKAGYAVLAYDMIGFGTRQHEATRFYQRYPNWSLMGKMVEDVKAAIDVVYDLPVADTAYVILSGYSLGATVSVFAAVADPRVTDVVVLDPFTPFRSKDETIEGIEKFYKYKGLIPRLGLYQQKEMEIPVDLQEMLVASDARKSVVINEKSRHIDPDIMKDQLDNAAKRSKLQVQYLPRISQFTSIERQQLVEMIKNFHVNR